MPLWRRNTDLWTIVALAALVVAGQFAPRHRESVEPVQTAKPPRGQSIRPVDPPACVIPIEDGDVLVLESGSLACDF